ncbi:cation/H(+) antiporter [Streptomyces sp. HUCO-GS316]|uniref:cation:proton antiporter n=1 Tax=Streptomyces sp. HUCO-GS316 TaxID=2692198 RepID=UPI00136B9513|nr:cation:proton antiporter [Streptomyces sp. HUCO-GS316]MXM68584.1 cation/H(+) antiporter [Streptomyces sp. HUCO-GS316]
MTSHQVQFLFLDFGLILLLARSLGALAGRIGQPPVVGEILAGILMGPTLFGAAFADRLVPADVRPLLGALANIGVALFMFVVGLELEHRFLRGRVRITFGAALGSTLVPFALGIPLAFFLLRHHPTEQRAAFVVFTGLSVSVTAFPVLARILVGRGMSRMAIGGLALATAAVVDVVAWSALAGVQAVVAGADDYWQVSLLIPFTLLLLAVRPLLRRVLVHGGSGSLPPTGMAVVMVGVFLSGVATEMMGMHYIFGAFLFGVLMPREGTQALREEIYERTGEITSLLLPVYFVVAGLKVDLRGVGLDGLTELAAILFVAIAGKFGGTYLGARSQGLTSEDSGTLAALMNTRGLTELVILGVGLELGLLDGPLYSLMVVMALVTTAMTGPVLNLIRARSARRGLAAVPDPDTVGGDAAGDGVPSAGRGTRAAG